MFEDILESPLFWILGGGGTIAVLIGWIASRKMEWTPLPFWQIIVIIIGILVASAYFSSRE